MLSTARQLGGWGASSVQNLKTCEIILLQLNNSPDISNFNGMVQHATAPLPSAQWLAPAFDDLWCKKKPHTDDHWEIFYRKIGGGGGYSNYLLESVVL